MNLYQKILKYLGIYQAFFKASFVADLEYRLNFVILVIGEFIWYSTQLILFEVLYRHTNIIGEWDVHQMRVFIFLVLFVDSIYMILWDPNFSSFTDNVRKGTLDLLLMKPINSMFMLSSQRISVSHIPCFFITFGGLIWALYQQRSLMQAWYAAAPIATTLTTTCTTTAVTSAPLPTSLECSCVTP